MRLNCHVSHFKPLDGPRQANKLRQGDEDVFNAVEAPQQEQHHSKTAISTDDSGLVISLKNKIDSFISVCFCFI